MRIHILVIMLFLLPSITGAQTGNFRIKVNFSIKEKRSDGTFALQMGNAYYDVNHKKLLYDISFPKPQTILTNDSTIYLIENGKVADVKKQPGFIEMSIFHLCLTGSIQNFGLQNTAYKATKVENENGMVITTWEIPKNIKGGNKTKIITSVKDRHLFGVVFLDADDKVISKQFYQDYQNYNGTMVPGKVIFIVYTNGQEQYRIMEFKSVVINEFANENLYNYPTPATGPK